MWRGTVVERFYEGRVSVMIPHLYRDSVIRDIQCSFDAQVGERVVVADLHPKAKVHDWWVLGRESDVGFGGIPYTHRHPLEEIDGLEDALAGKADTTALSSYATTTALNTKADAPGPWATCTPSSYIVKEEGADIQVRTIPGGVQIRCGRWRYAPDVPRDATIFTLPTGYEPPWVMYFFASAMSAASNNYDAINVHLEARTTGAVRARSAHQAAPLITLNQTLLY